MTTRSSSTCASATHPRPPTSSTHLALNTEPSFGYTYDDTDSGAELHRQLVTRRKPELHRRRLQEHRELQRHDRRLDVGHVHRHRGAVHRPDGEQPRLRRRLPRRQQGRQRRRLLAGHRLPAGALLGERAERHDAHAEDRRHRPEGRGLGRHVRVRRRDQRADRRSGSRTTTRPFPSSPGPRSRSRVGTPACC